MPAAHQQQAPEVLLLLLEPSCLPLLLSVPKPSPRWDAESVPPLLPRPTATGNNQHLSPNLGQHLLIISFPNKLP